jgi:hypothetical protein
MYNTGATMHLLKNIDMVENVRKEDGVTIQTMSRNKVSVVGSHLDLRQCFVDKDLPWNIVSGDCLKRNGTVSYEQTL